MSLYGMIGAYPLTGTMEILTLEIVSAIPGTMIPPGMAAFATTGPTNALYIAFASSGDAFFMGYTTTGAGRVIRYDGSSYVVVS